MSWNGAGDGAPIQRLLGQHPDIAARPPRFDWKTKCFPSGVQFPQHSAWDRTIRAATAAVFCLANVNSQSDVARVAESITVNRKREPSGAQRSQKALPGDGRSKRALPGRRRG